jgi:SAM-dependent methyltransferase
VCPPPPRPQNPDVQAFVAGSPINRFHIAEFVAVAARSIEPGARVLDAGAGAAPYRPLFAHTSYTTSDWAASSHAEARHSDIIAELSDLPVADSSFDAVIMTEVLEHVADPSAAILEVRRVLAPGGRVWLTTPFVWELHEEPYDYWRYTPHALRELLTHAGFVSVEVVPFGGWFSVAGQLLRNFGSITGRDQTRRLAGRALLQLLARAGTAVSRLDRLDRRRGLPLGFGTSATRN